MASPARKVRTDQREKPRDLSVDFALPYPVECPALVTHDDVMRAWSVLFLPAFAAENVVTALHVTTDNGKTWPTVRHKKPSIAYVGKALIAHLNAGETGKPWPLDGEGSIHAIGARFRKDERTCILNFDLDGRTNAREFVRSLESIGVRGLLTSSSGKPGKFRYLVFFDRWHTIGEAQALGKTLCESLGFKVKKGAVEIFPGPVNGRLPCGYGALTVYDPAYLNDGIALTLPAFLRTFYALPRVELARIVDELQLSPERTELGNRRKEPRKRGKNHVPSDVSRWEKDGVEPGERERALWDLAMHAWFQGKNHGDTVDLLTDWIVRGGMDRSRYMHEHRNAIARQIQDLPRIVSNVREVCETFKPSAVNSPPAHLSAADVLLLNADVERVFALGTWTRACVERFAWTSVPLFKGAFVAGKLDDQGRPIARIHWERWEAAASGQADYASLRDAFGWFVPISGYLPAKFAKDPKDAHARTWALVPRLTSDAPTRALGSTWGLALTKARKRVRKQNNT